jgi:AAHS family benzoate transporter-like MFS transporter
MIGGALLTAGVAYPWGFFVFAAVGLTAAVTTTLVTRDEAREVVPEVVTTT